jgi:hypothetical protein
MSIRLTNEQTPQDKRTAVLNELQEQIKSIKIIQEVVNKNNDYERETHNLYREPLSIETTTEIKVLLSWGGGEVGFKLRFKDKELLSGVYYFADWGQYEEVSLNEDELNLIYEFYLFSEYPEEPDKY